MLTSKQRAILRGKANTMDPVFIVGKGEIDETMIQGVKDCLDARELIKLKVLETHDGRWRCADAAVGYSVPHD